MDSRLEAVKGAAMYCSLGAAPTMSQAKKVTTTNKLAICVINYALIYRFSRVLHAHQPARESTEIARPCGIGRLVMVITRKY